MKEDQTRPAQSDRKALEEKGLSESLPNRSLIGFLEHNAKKTLKSRFYPWPARWMMITFLVVFSYSVIFGPLNPSRNFATVMSWIVWWPLLAVSYLIIGRVWCAVCPMGALSDLVYHRVGLNLKAPVLFKKRPLIIGMVVTTMIFMAWIEEVARAPVSPLITGFILWTFTSGAVISGLLFERWTWCRHLCPLGVWSGIFAQSSLVEVRANQDVCREKRCDGVYCYFGREKLPGCPFKEIPKTMESNRYCSACGSCIKACPHDAITVRLRPPGQEFLTRRKGILEGAHIAVLAISLVGFQAFAMTRTWHTIHRRLAELPVLSHDIALYGLLILTFAGTAVVLFYLASRVHARLAGQSLEAEMSRFGFALLPLALMAHIGHNLGHLFHGYRLIPGALASLAGLEVGGVEMAPNFGLWQVAEILLVITGLLMSIRIILSICELQDINCSRRLAAMPYILLTVAYAVLLTVIFSLPMTTRVS